MKVNPRRRIPKLTRKQILELLRRGAKSANELREQLERDRYLTPAQWGLTLR